MSAISKNIVIIGGGPGGYESAIEGAKLGHNITLIESHKVGGTCLHYGCIPTKTLHHTAKMMSHIDDVPGLTVSSSVLDYEAMMLNKQKVVDTLTAGIIKQLKALNVQVIYGNASLTESGVQIDSGENKVQLSPDIVLIATGSVPKILNINGVDSNRVLTSKTLLSQAAMPKSLVIIGAGVIGMEFAFIYNAFGCDVTVIEYLDQILPNQDQAISKRLRSMAKKSGIQILTKTKALDILDGEDSAMIRFCDREDSSKVSELNSEYVLLATGRQPNLASLNFTEVGVHTDGYKVLVDETFKTNMDHVYAIGDLIDQGMLAHVASHQGKWLMHHLKGEAGPYDTLMPSAVFTMPEIGSVGFTEEQLQASQIDYRVHKTMYGVLGKAHAIQETEGFIKILTDDSDVVIGVHILGEDASNLIQEGVLAIKKRMTLDELRSIIHVHPTLSELYL